MDCSPPGSPVHGIPQAIMLEWVVMPFSRGSSPPRDQTPISLCLLDWQAGTLPVPPPGKLRKIASSTIFNRKKTYSGIESVILALL